MLRVTSESLMAATLVAVASIMAFWLFHSWAPVAEKVAGDYPGGADDAKRLVREYFPFHVVPPSWLPQTEDLFWRWELTEERAREISVILLWLSVVMIVILRDAKVQRRKA
jgi:hypothetical protein